MPLYPFYFLVLCESGSGGNIRILPTSGSVLFVSQNELESCRLTVANVVCSDALAAPADAPRGPSSYGPLHNHGSAEESSLSELKETRRLITLRLSKQENVKLHLPHVSLNPVGACLSPGVKEKPSPRSIGSGQGRVREAGSAVARSIRAEARADSTSRTAAMKRRRIFLSTE
jgi:hypothetical protein